MRPCALFMNPGPLSGDEIARLLNGDAPLLEGFTSLELQLQPNGFDLSVRSVSRFVTRGQIGATDDSRVLADVAPLNFDADEWLFLAAASYLVSFNEVVNLPADLMALGRPRSSLLRSGVSLHTAVWDAGYHGRSQSLLTVHHQAGFRLQRNSRLAQLVFLRLSAPSQQGYRGRYQDEGL